MLLTQERRGWDSNPCARKDKRFSRPPRYDRFDTSPVDFLSRSWEVSLRRVQEIFYQVCDFLSRTFFLSSFCENRSQKLPNCFGLFSRTFEVNRSQKSLMQFLLASFAHIHLSVAVISRRFRPLYSGFQRLAVCVAHRRQVLF